MVRTGGLVGLCALLVVASAGCERTTFSDGDTRCEGRIGFSPCDDGTAADAGVPPPRLLPDAPAATPSDGGVACSAQYGFEDGTLQGFEASPCCGVTTNSLENTTARAWCGQRALKLPLNAVAPDLSIAVREVHTVLPTGTDLSGKTLTVHVFLDAPAGGRVYALVAATGPLGTLIPGPASGLPAGIWSALSVTFDPARPPPVVDAISVQILGADFTGAAVAYFDEIGWQ